MLALFMPMAQPGPNRIVEAVEQDPPLAVERKAFLGGRESVSGGKRSLAGERLLREGAFVGGRSVSWSEKSSLARNAFGGGKRVLLY